MVRNETRQRSGSVETWPKLPSWQKGKTQWKIKEEALASALHGHKLNTKKPPPFPFSLAYRQEKISMREGVWTEKQKEGKQNGRSKCKGNRSILTIWTEVIYQNDLLDKAGRGAVQDTAGTQGGKRQMSVSCHNNNNGRTDTNLLCYTLQQEYQTPVMWKS